MKRERARHEERRYQHQGKRVASSVVGVVWKTCAGPGFVVIPSPRTHRL